MSPSPILLLNRAEVISVLTWPELIEVTRRALVELAAPDRLPSLSSQLVVPGAALHLKAGALASPPLLSVKANLRPDRGSSSGAILAFDLEDQRLQAVLASSDLTAMRSAAIAAVAARTLVGSGPVTVALVGAGLVAQRVDEALDHLGITSDLRVWSRTRERADALVASYHGGVPHQVCESVTAALEGAGLVVSCTPSSTPLVAAHDVSPGAVILAMGADSPGKRELGAGVLDDADLYADVPDDALRVGECSSLRTEDAGRVQSIGSLLAAADAYESRGRAVVFDSVGSSAVDAVAVGLVLREAQRLGLGQRIDLDSGR